MSAIQNGFRTFKSVLFTPTQFFSELSLAVQMLLQSGKKPQLSSALALAALSSWVGAAFQNAFTQWTFQPMLQQFSQLFRGDQEGYLSAAINRMVESAWIFGTGGVILAPFLTLIGIFFMSVVLLLGAKLFIRPGVHTPLPRVDFETTVLITAYASVSSVFKAIPYLGGIISSVYFFILISIGFRRVYQTTGNRGLLVALFPGLLFMFFVFVLLMLVFLAFFVLRSGT